MFEKEKANPLESKAWQDHMKEQLEHIHQEKEHWHEQKKICEKASEFLDRESEKEKAPKMKREKITLNAKSPVEFVTEGYRYNTFVIGDYEAGTVLTIDYMGVKYTEILKSGVNTFNLFDGATITSDRNITLMLIRTAFAIDIEKEQNAVIVDVFEGTGENIYSFRTYCHSLVVANDDVSADLTLGINGLSLLIKAGEVFEESFSSFNTIHVSTTGSYRIYGRA